QINDNSKLLVNDVNKLKDLAQDESEFYTLADTQYYDDNISLRSIPAQLLYIKLLQQFGPEFGLYINVQKSKISVHDFDKLDQVNKNYILQYFSEANIQSHGNVDNLGIAFGEDTYVAKFMMDKIKNWENELELINQIKSHHIQFNILLKYYNASKLIYFLRNFVVLSRRYINTSWMKRLINI